MLSVNQQIIDLGEIHFGKTYSFSYNLTNKYPFKLKINKVYAGCSSCTTVSIDKQELDTDETADIKVSFTPGSTGVQNKFVHVAYSGPGNKVYPDFQLKFKGIVNG